LSRGVFKSFLLIIDFGIVTVIDILILLFAIFVVFPSLIMILETGGKEERSTGAKCKKILNNYVSNSWKKVHSYK